MPRSPYAAEPAAPPAEVAAPTRTPQGKVREKLDASKPKSFKTYSRFGRDPEVYFWTIDHVLYGLARAAANTTNVIRVWSAGCAGGEEPYSLAIAWSAVLAERFPTVKLEIIATDIDEASLRRAKAGVFDVHIANFRSSGSPPRQLLDDSRYELAEDLGERLVLRATPSPILHQRAPSTSCSRATRCSCTSRRRTRASREGPGVLQGTLVTSLSDSLPQDTLWYVYKGRRMASTGVPRASRHHRTTAARRRSRSFWDWRTGSGPSASRRRAGDGVARQPPDFGEDVRGEDPFPEHLPADGVDGRRAGAESGGAEDGRGLREHGAAPGVAAAAARSARVAPPEPARRPAPPPRPRGREGLPEAARAALFDRLQRPRARRRSAR